MKNRLFALWEQLTAPQSTDMDEARREYMTRIISLIMTLISGALTLIFGLGWVMRLFPGDSVLITLGMVLFFGLAWWLTLRGHWRIAGYFPVAVIFATAVYGNYVGGPGAPAMVLYVLAMALTAVLQSERAQWITMLLSVLSFAGIGWAQVYGPLKAWRSVDEVFKNRVVIVIGTYATLSSLMWLLVSQFKRTLIESRAFAGKLALINHQLEQQIEERRRAQEAEQEQRVLSDALRDTAAALSSTLHFDQVLERILFNVRRVVPHDAANIMLVDMATRQAHVVLCYGYDQIENGLDKLVMELCFDLDGVPNLLHMMASGEPFIISDTHDYAAWVDTPATRWVRSYAGAPIRVGNETVGFLNLDSATPHFYASQHSERLRALADQAAIAVENAHLYEQAEREIAERRRAEESLSQERNLLRTLIDILPDSIYVKDVIGRKVLANRVDLQYMGVQSEAEVIGKTDLDFFPPDAAQELVTDDQQVIQTARPMLNKPERFEWQGETIYLLTSKVPLRDSTGQVVGLVGTGRNISDYVKAQQGLEQERAFLRQVIDALPAWIYVREQDGHLALVNAAMAQSCGTTVQALTDPSSCAMFLQPDMWEEDRRVIEMRMAQMLSEKQMAYADGSTHWHATIRVPLLDADGGCRQVLVVSSDISERKRVEEEKDRLQTQLLQAQKMEAIGRLAGGVAHDFNNHLTAIIGYADILLNELGGDDPRRSNVQEIKQAAQRSAALTGQLLAFSRKQIIRPVTFNLNDRLMSLRDMLQRLLGEDVRLQIHCAPGGAWVHADPGQIEQVIMNLAVNGRDAMPSGGQLIIETAYAELDESYRRHRMTVEPGTYVMLSVTDNGIGMDQEVQSRLFEPFFTTKEEGKGTGLGLATVFGIVRQNNGYIWVYSEPGQGSTFKVYLPLVDRNGEPSAQARTAAAPLPGSETVLLVEDEDTVRMLVQRILERQGYHILASCNAEDALRLCAEHKGQIDLLISDVIMPGGTNGRELARQIMAARPGIKVLFMSGYTDDVIAHHGVLEAGVNFISKPFTTDALAHKVRQAIEGNASRSG